MAEDGAVKKPRIKGSMWLYIGAAVAVVAILVIMRNRAAAAAAGGDQTASSGGFLSGLFGGGTTTAAPTASNAVPTGTGGTDFSGNDVTNQGTPYPPTTNTSNVFQNTTTPPPTPTPVQVVPTPTTPVTSQPQAGSVTVLPGWHFDQWLSDLNKQGYNITGQQLLAANPDLMANIAWDPTTKLNYFKTQKQYNIPAANVPQTYAK